MQNQRLQSKNPQRGQIEEFKSSHQQERAGTDRQRPLLRLRRNPGFKPKFNSTQTNPNTPRKFVDPDFPPTYKSLVGDLSEKEIVDTFEKPSTEVSEIVWRRADDIFGKGKYQIFGKKIGSNEIFEEEIEPDDIRQGELGDCYYLCSIAALAENSNRIRKLFIDQEVNDEGKYRVKIYDMGIQKIVTIDDYFPCDPVTGKPIFANSNGNELWVLLLEKAWAKLYGSYARIVSGFPDEPFHDLTGAPTVFYLTKYLEIEDKIWDDLCKGERQNYAMACCTYSNPAMNKKQIFADHAYSILAAFELKDGKKTIRMVQLRNPWGKTEWEGDWSDSSPKWTPQLKKQLQGKNLQLKKKNDGIFFMAYEDMLGFFDSVQICKVHDDYVYKSIKSSCDHQQTKSFNFKVLQKGSYCITINQENERKHAEREQYRYSMVNVNLQAKFGKQHFEIDKVQGASKEIWLDNNLGQGEYVVRVEIDWNEKENKEFSISFYGEGEVEIKGVESVPIQKKGGDKNIRQQPIQAQLKKLNFGGY